MILLLCGILLSTVSQAFEISASSSSFPTEPKMAIDGNSDTVWNSGGFAPQWIQVDLGTPQILSKIKLQVSQNPRGRTIHAIYGGLTSDLFTLLDVVDGYTRDGDWLEASFLPTPNARVRYIKILTLKSPSWVAWREIQIESQPQAKLNTPKYFGYYASGLKIDRALRPEFVSGTRVMDEVRNQNNVFWIGEKDGYLQKLAKTRDSGLKTVLSVGDSFFDPAKPTQLLPNYAELWAQYAETIRPYLNVIAAFYPVDEPNCNTDPAYRKVLETVNATIKQTFPDIPVAVIFAWDAFEYKTCIPDGYDWLGYDCYGGTKTGHTIEWYVGKLKEQMNSKQRVMLVPNGSIPKPNPTLEDQVELIHIINQYYDYAVSDPVVIGIFPFLYQSFLEGDVTWTGVSDLSLVQDRYLRMGQAIMSGSQNLIARP